MALWNNHSSNTDASMVDAANSPPLLRGAFGRAALDEAHVSLIHSVVRAQESMILMARDSDTIAGMMDRGARIARSVRDVGDRLKARQKRSFDTQMMLNLLDQRIALLAGRVAEAERSFVEQYGDAWAEELALEILDPDEIPEREAGETIEQYRERLRPLLIDRLLDESGEIRPEYLNHPKYGQFAQWAKDEHDMRPLLEGRAQIDAIQSDATLSDAEREAGTREILEGMNVQELQASREIGEMGVDAEALARQEADDRIDERLNSGAASSTFDAFG